MLALLPAMGPVELVILAVILCMLIAGIEVPLFAIIDAAKRPDKDWQNVGVDRMVWILLIAGGTLVFAPIGLVFATYYLVAMRPRLDAGQDPFARP